MKLEMTNQMLIETIQSLAAELTEDDTIKIGMDVNHTKNYRDIVIRVRTKPVSNGVYLKQHFETGHTLNISLE
ncbi:hypothetical protein LCAA2362_3083 [Lacticaseibacillus casei A2-362]|nr:hypothetical protein LCAA2362_3083 [Lacticaseibacillus casei A2-362]